jgi:O-6-methylguanine DNA methyltransferase
MRTRSPKKDGAPDPFSQRVLWVVRRIPPGRVATYGEVAALAGRPRAARAVGNIMRGCGRPDVPCHRVIAAGGRLGGYGGSEALKRALLAAEGIIVAGGRVRELERVRWTPTRNARNRVMADRLRGTQSMKRAKQ